MANSLCAASCLSSLTKVVNPFASCWAISKKPFERSECTECLVDCREGTECTGGRCAGCNDVKEATSMSAWAEVADTGRNALAAPKRGDDRGGGGGG